MTNDLEDARVKQEEQYAKKELGLLLHRLRNLPAASRANLQAVFTQRIIDETLAVETPLGPLSFVLLGRGAGARAMSLLTKQPATIAWIDSFSPNSVFRDVGANIGVYSLYAALRRGTRIVAFEPAAINYFLLAANVEANCLDSQVDCLLVGLGNERAVARLEVSQFMPARSFSFRGKKGQPYPSRQAALMVSMDQLIEDYGLECPNYIKIDVPGPKEEIVAGGERMLQRSNVREVHIECAAEGRGAQHIVAMLARAGFVVSSQSQSGGSTDTTFTRRASKPFDAIDGR